MGFGVRVAVAVAVEVIVGVNVAVAVGVLVKVAVAVGVDVAVGSGANTLHALITKDRIIDRTISLDSFIFIPCWGFFIDCTVIDCFRSMP